MRSTRWITTTGLAVALAGCAVAVDTTEGLLDQAGFRKLPADTPKQVQHLQTIRAHRLIRRQADGKPYYVYADPDYCKCLYVGSESAYAKYRTLVERQDEAIVLEEDRREESVQGVK